MFVKMITPHEPLVADRARKPLVSTVRAQVSLQLVTASEALPAEQPVADEGPLARVPAQVRLQVRRLVVDLSASGDVAAVDVALAQRVARRTESVGFLAVRTVTV